MARLEKLMQMLEHDPRDTFVLYAIAQEKGKSGDLPGAIEYYARCLEVDPDYCYAWYHKAAAEHEAGDDAAAAQTLEGGLQAAQRTGDAKAQNEMRALLDEVNS